MPYCGVHVPCMTWPLSSLCGLCVCPTLPDTLISKQSQIALWLFTHICESPLPWDMTFFGRELQPKAKDESHAHLLS